MGEESIIMRVEINILDNGRMVKGQAWELFTGLMVIGMLVIS